MQASKTSRQKLLQLGDWVSPVRAYETEHPCDVTHFVGRVSKVGHWYSSLRVDWMAVRGTYPAWMNESWAPEKLRRVPAPSEEEIALWLLAMNS